MIAFSGTPGRTLGSLLMFEMATRNELTNLEVSKIAPKKQSIRGNYARIDTETHNMTQQDRNVLQSAIKNLSGEKKNG